MWDGVGDRTELQHIDLHSIGQNCVSFPFSWAAQPGLGRPASLGHVPQSSIFSPTRLISKLLNRRLRAPSAGCWLSLPHLIPNWLNFLCTELYNSPRPPSSCGSHNFALIQLVHGQGCNILIKRMHLLFTQVYFLFWQPGRVVGQYTTIYPVNWSLIPQTTLPYYNVWALPDGCSLMYFCYFFPKTNIKELVFFPLIRLFYLSTSSYTSVVVFHLLNLMSTHI